MTNNNVKNYVTDKFTIEKIGDKYLISFFATYGEELQKLHDILLTKEQVEQLVDNLKTYEK